MWGPPRSRPRGDAFSATKTFPGFFFLREKKQELVQSGKRGETTLLLPLGCSVLCFVHTHGERRKGKAKRMHWLIGYAAKANCRGQQPFPAAEKAGLSLAQLRRRLCAGFFQCLKGEGGSSSFFLSLFSPLSLPIPIPPDSLHSHPKICDDGGLKSRERLIISLIITSITYNYSKTSLIRINWEENQFKFLTSWQITFKLRFYCF